MAPATSCEIGMYQRKVGIARAGCLGPRLAETRWDAERPWRGRAEQRQGAGGTRGQLPGRRSPALRQGGQPRGGSQERAHSRSALQTGCAVFTVATLARVWFGFVCGGRGSGGGEKRILRGLHAAPAPSHTREHNLS